ncbi:MAG: type II toxin-antitoxin system VapC family toxin [Thaumarchaeota archaeon]|nr:type II toxin-antitoxin system VapC family toxin [Nitrososphaerota archaeon]
MKQFYMDTNVFVSRLKSDDPYHVEAKAIVRSLEDDEIQAETSVLALLEVASVSGRLYEAKKGEKGEKGRKVFVVRILSWLAGIKPKFINISGDTPVSIRGVQASLPSIFNEAILLSLQSTLRTLDLIRLAAARHAKRMNNELGAFVTGDKEFLSNKKELSRIIGMPILSPKEYAEGLGLQ